MSSIYSHHGVQFVIPGGWTVEEDDLDEVIRAITVDTPSEGYCMIDIYKTAQSPDLTRYIDNQLKHFVEALPLGYKVIEGPLSTEERASNQGQEVVGLVVNLVIRSMLRRRIPDSNAFYRGTRALYGTVFTALPRRRVPAASARVRGAS